LRPFKPYTSYDSDGKKSYLWWRTEFVDARVPELADVRTEVLQTWKMIQARKLAQAQAKEFADEVNRRHITLKDAFMFKPEVSVREIGPFTWLSRPQNVPSFPDQPVPIRLTQLPGLEGISQEFMRTVFNLEAGTAGTAPNLPETIFYAVQVISFDTSETMARRAFLMRMANPLGDESLQAARWDAAVVVEARIKAIEDEFGLKMVTPTAAATDVPPPTDYSED
jgi:hypothetical protein